MAGLASRYQTLLAGGVAVTAAGIPVAVHMAARRSGRSRGLDQLRDLAATEQG